MRIKFFAASIVAVFAAGVTLLGQQAVRTVASSLLKIRGIENASGITLVDPTANGVRFLLVKPDGSIVTPSTDATHGGTISATGPQVMLWAANDISTHAPVTDNTPTRSSSDLLGRPITKPYCDAGAEVRGTVSITDGSSTSVIAAQGAGKRIEVWGAYISNEGTVGVRLDIRDGTAGTVLGHLPAPEAAAASGSLSGAAPFIPIPFRGTANTAIAVDPSAATAITVTLTGCRVQ